MLFRQVSDVGVAFSGAFPAWLPELASKGLFAGLSIGMRRMLLATLGFGSARATAQAQAQDDALQTLRRAYVARVLGAPRYLSRRGEF